jgi:cysteinyl-tRNA synthetase
MGLKKEEFIPLKDREVGIYTCGVTVYDYCHVGHARSIISFDVIVRYLIKKGYKVTFVRNFTDIDDKIINRANKENKSWKEIAERYIEAYYEDIGKLNIIKPTYEPKATEHIEEIIELVKKLIERGFAYVVDGDVYFEVDKFKGYGKLSGRKKEELMAGTRIDVDERKKNPLDFALWKAPKPGEPYWKSPWGEGRPGWHIECSAMSMKYLGETFDIHGGGMDLIFPHHENEIAQSEAATSKPFVKYWLHNGFVNINNEKMSKSLGNIILIRDILKLYHPEELRLAFIKVHYRSPFDFSYDKLESERESLEKLYRTKEKVEEILKEKDLQSEHLSENVDIIGNLRKEFYKAMDDDFNSAVAIGKFFEAVREYNRMIEHGSMDLNEKIAVSKKMKEFIKDINDVFGILLEDPKDWFKGKGTSLPIPQEEIERLIEERRKARMEKNFKRADEIRDYLKSLGIILEDRIDGKTVWRLER